jgi:small subunit ribosomal protein S24e
LKLEIDSKKENALQERSEIQFTVEHAGEPTPKRDEMRAKLAEKVGVPKERVIIDHTETEYGMGLSKGYAKVYASIDAAKKAEKNYMLVRHGLAQKKVKVKVAPTKAAPKPK